MDPGIAKAVRVLQSPDNDQVTRFFIVKKGEVGGQDFLLNAEKLVVRPAPKKKSNLAAASRLRNPVYGAAFL